MPQAMPQGTASAWQLQYGDKHRLRRLKDFPKGIAPPQKVRIYERRDHFVLQWWDRRAKRTNSLRIDGDLVAAVTQAREIEQRLQQHRSPPALGQPKQSHAELVRRFLADV